MYKKTIDSKYESALAQLINKNINSFILSSPQLYENAVIHGVANKINANLSALLSQESITDISTEDIASLKELNNKIGTFAQHSRICTSIIDNTAKELLYTLKKRNMEVVVLKGFSLAYQVYSEPYLRPKSDIDILIKKEDKAKVTKIFKELGYNNPRGWEPQAIINQFSMKKRLSKGVNVLFDVHLKISNSKQIEDILNYDELIQTANKNHLPQINLVNKPYALVHAIFHLLHHKSMGDLIKLIWYYDIYLIIDQLDDNELEQLKSIISDKGLATLVAYTLELTSRYFESDKITQLKDYCETAEIKLTSNHDYNYLMGSVYGVKGVWLTLRATDGLINKLAILKEMVFPPSAEIYIKYGDNSKWPLPILYLIRISTGTFKYIFQQKK